MSYQNESFHQNESCLACPHPPSSYEGGREQVDSSHFDENSHFDRTLRYLRIWVAIKLISFNMNE